MAEESTPSFNQQMRSLPKGSSLGRVKRFEVGKHDSDYINAELHSLRRTVNASVSRIREATGSNFRVESGLMLTNDNAALLAVVSVTRV